MTTGYGNPQPQYASPKIIFADFATKPFPKGRMLYFKAGTEA